jgi:predicted amidohydrolase
MTSGEDKEANLEAATRLVERAAKAGATLIALPELFNCLGRMKVVTEQAEQIPGPTSEAMSALASRLQVTLVAGSICERSAGHDKPFNTSLVFSPDGREIGRYRKVHLFDIDLPGRVTYQESSWLSAGEELSAVNTPMGCLGQAICYDLRFPELFRALADEQMQILVLPAAFTLPTGRDHWEVLLRARAIENQVFVIAPNQCGQHSSELQTYGRSMIVDPWGTTMATAPDGEGFVTAEIDLQRMSEIRTRLPALKHRRWPLRSSSENARGTN